MESRSLFIWLLFATFIISSAVNREFASAADCPILTSTTPQTMSEDPAADAQEMRDTLKYFKKLLSVIRNERAHYNPHNEQQAIEHMENREPIKELEAILELKAAYARLWLLGNKITRPHISRAQIQQRLLQLQTDITYLWDYLGMRLYPIQLHMAHMNVPVLGKPDPETNPVKPETVTVTDAPDFETMLKILNMALKRYEIRLTNLVNHLALAGSDVPMEAIIFQKIVGVQSPDEAEESDAQ